MIDPPNKWLPNLDPGFGPKASQGIEFITGSGGLISFIVSTSIFLIFVLSLVFIVIGGIMWITSGGNKEGLAKAKSTITYAIIGLVLGIGSFIILNILGQFFGVNLLGENFPLFWGNQQKGPF